MGFDACALMSGRRLEGGPRQFCGALKFWNGVLQSKRKAVHEGCVNSRRDCAGELELLNRKFIADRGFRLSAMTTLVERQLKADPAALRPHGAEFPVLNRLVIPVGHRTGTVAHPVLLQARRQVGALTEMGIAEAPERVQAGSVSSGDWVDVAEVVER